MIGSSSTLLVKQHGYRSLRHLPQRHLKDIP